MICLSSDVSTVTPTNFDEPETFLATLIALRPELICIVI